MKVALQFILLVVRVFTSYTFFCHIQGLGTSTPQEGREYFGDLGKHKKDFVWDDEQDGSAIEMAFSKKKAEDRKTWIRNFEVLRSDICVHFIERYDELPLIFI